MMDDKQGRYTCFIRFFKRALIMSAVFIFGLFPVSANAYDILIGTGKTGTFSHFTGRVLCRIINNPPSEMSCKTTPSKGDMHNLTNLQSGSLDMSIVDSRMLHDAVNKAGYFKYLDISYDNLRVLVPLYDIPITLVVRSDAGIRSLDELKGKRLNAGAPRSIEQLAVDTIWKVKNWSEKDFGLVQELPSSQSQDTMAFCHGNIQAMVHIGVHPDPALQKLVKLCQADLVDMNDGDIGKMVNEHPAFSKTHIPAGMYPSRSKNVVTFGTKAVLVASSDLDEQTVQQIMKRVYGNLMRLKGSHPALSPLRPEAAKNFNLGIELHPGAAKFFSAN